MPGAHDGELFDLAATRIEFTILPGRLRVIAPEAGKRKEVTP